MLYSRAYRRNHCVVDSVFESNTQCGSSIGGRCYIPSYSNWVDVGTSSAVVSWMSFSSTYGRILSCNASCQLETRFRAVRQRQWQIDPPVTSSTHLLVLYDGIRVCQPCAAPVYCRLAS